MKGLDKLKRITLLGWLVAGAWWKDRMSIRRSLITTRVHTLVDKTVPLSSSTYFSLSPGSLRIARTRELNWMLPGGNCAARASIKSLRSTARTSCGLQNIGWMKQCSQAPLKTLIVSLWHEYPLFYTGHHVCSHYTCPSPAISSASLFSTLRYERNNFHKNNFFCNWILDLFEGLCNTAYTLQEKAKNIANPSHFFITFSFSPTLIISRFTLID